MRVCQKSFFKLPPPLRGIESASSLESAPLDRQRVNSLSVLAYSLISLYKQRES